MIDIHHVGTHDRSKSAGALQATLIELQALQLATKQAHWNVSGMLFWSMHEMLDAHYEAIAAMTDEVAERLLSTGNPADGRPRTIVERSPIAEMPDGLLDDSWLLAYFAEQYAVVADRLLERIGDIEEDDPTSANLLQEVEHLVEKNQWQVRAHLEARPTDSQPRERTGMTRPASRRRPLTRAHAPAAKS
ncbi:MAG TPA: ferritin-like domain-containing protein [Gemmatimonadaceae bacterium]|nr:ferritin-like domain-containing protein [Gemmatimonadaceae bacterium]